MPFIQQLGLQNLLSFSPETKPIDFQPLNVLIGPNGSGKTNAIEGLELISATPTDFAAAIRRGGGIEEWLWKGESRGEEAKLEVQTFGGRGGKEAADSPLQHTLLFSASGSRLEIVDEEIRNVSVSKKPERTKSTTSTVGVIPS